ncbi:MAG TPA: YraN family protein [Anaerolineaceae bacterium]|nr:YraN family protein [Anaerolineaceae bacterium]
MKKEMEEVIRDKIFIIMERKTKQQLARWGEEVAKKFLEVNKILVLHSNFRTSSGEIDIIGKENDDLVFFEVKTRSSTEFGFPEDAVDSKKIQKIELVANDYLDALGNGDDNWRIDTIAIIRNPYNGKYKLEWYKNVDS